MKAKRIVTLFLSAMLLTAAALPAAAAERCPVKVNYALGVNGVSAELTAEAVEVDGKPVKVPQVRGLNGYTFLGWCLTDPAKLKAGEEPELVDPSKITVDRDTTFYAIYALPAGHKAYVLGYPDGRFGPADPITRGSVATIIARSCLEGFVEGYDYGNPGGYSDVDAHWALSAISYCTMKGVFKGMGDGSFQPDLPITRQEFALVIARLAGVKANSGTPFSDEGEISDWAVDGVYTAYANGWINGYPDGTFQPMNNIRRDEAVKIFNGYLNRGVDAQGLAGMKGLAAWPDVTVEGEWAYYEIMEAGNDHQFHYRDQEKLVPPEVWDEG